MSGATRMILRARTVVPAHDLPAIDDGAVLVRDGVVESIGAYRELRQSTDAPEQDAGTVLMPGMIDAHSHLRGIPLLEHGIPARPLETWLCTLAAMTPLSPGDEALVATAEQLETGITGVQGFVHAFDDAEGYAAIAREIDDAVRATGIRALLVLGFTDRAERAPLPADGDWALVPGAPHGLDGAGFAAFAQSWLVEHERHLAAEDLPLVRWGVGPVAAQWTTDEALARIAAVTAGRRIHTHLNESELQRDWIAGETAPLDRLDAAGLVDGRLSAAHAVHLLDAEIDRISAAGANLVHCPLSNDALQVGTARVAEWLRRGVVPALGVDSQNDQAPDMFAVMRGAMRSASRIGDPISARDAFALATTGGARALGVPSLGRITPGAPADLVALAFEPGNEVEAIVDGASARDVQSVWVGGRLVVRDGHAVTDVSAARRRLRATLDADAPARVARHLAGADVVAAVERATAARLATPASGADLMSAVRGGSRLETAATSEAPRVDTAELWARGAAELGEAPRWLPSVAREERAEGANVRPADARPGRLLWTDLLEGIVFERGVDGEAVAVTAFPDETVSALIPLREGSTAAVLHRRIALLDASGVWYDTIEAPGIAPGYRFSDATAGPSGHLWLGVVPAGPSAEPGRGCLVRLGRDGAHVVRTDIGFSNGIGFTADGRSLLLIDSEAGIISSIEHDAATGLLGEPDRDRVVFRLTADLTADLTASLVSPADASFDSPLVPALDGLAVDAHDRIWVAVFGGGVVLCVTLQGEVVGRVDVPARRVSSCCFGPGGALYITTARVDATSDELAAEPLAGSVFSSSTGCAGGPIWEGDIV